MKIKVSCRPKVDDKDVNIKNERAGGSQNKHEQIIENQAVIGSASRIQEGFRLLAEEVLTHNATTARSKALQQAIRKGVWQAQRYFQKQQPHQAQPQNAAVVCWDRFLPHQQLQVLLVEDDDATRHIVGALLRKCSFEVTPASSGLLAWELLMDPTNRIDLVLTEVVMPCLSGIGLLGRIMNHGALKHIPVIMMSSNDSMNVVFKCLSNGAVDFLVKPVRKNELKNLWQHVWRRCHSSSSSRTASGSHTQKPARHNDVTNFNEPGNNEDSDKASSDLNIRGGSDNGSCTQSPWTKTDLGGHQVNKLHSNEHRTNAGLQLSVKLEHNSSLGPKCQEDSKERTNAICLELVPLTHENFGTAASVADAPHRDDASVFPRGINQRAEDLMGILKEQDSNEEQREASEDEDGLIEKHASNFPRFKDKLSNFSSPPPLNSSSIQLKEASKGDGQISEKEARGVIHSSVSAFSRYNARGSFTPLIGRTGPANTHKPLVGFGEGVLRTLSVSTIATLHKEIVTFPHGGIENIASAKSPLETNTELECIAQVCPPAQPEVLSKADTPLSPPPDSSLGSKQAGIAHDLYLGAGPQAGENGERKDHCVSYEQDEIIYSHSNNHHQFHHHSHHHHHHHHIQHHYYHASEEKLRIRPEALQPNDQTVIRIRDGAPRWGSSYSMGNGTEVNIDAGGSSRHGSNVHEVRGGNRSGSGSNNGSNGVPGAAAVLPIEGQDLKTRIDEDNDLLDVNGASGSTENSLSRREAALTKFRQKRKERCFEKKVRYQSRKRLAEQRLRVRGQFVKQTMYEPTVQEP